MEPQKQEYSIHKLAQLAGVTVRALHHWDHIGLLCPHRLENGYRIYGPHEVERLQQILLYRATDMKLSDIQHLLDDPTFDVEQALMRHLDQLRARCAQTQTLIANVEHTLADLRNETPMSDTERFAAFKQNLIDKNESTYGSEARQHHGDKAVDATHERIRAMSESEWNETRNLEEEITRELARAVKSGNTAGPEAHHVCELHAA